MLDVLAERFGMAVDWTSSNVIPYFEQLCGKYINYEVVTSIVWMVLGVILAVISLVILNKNKDLGVIHYQTISDDYILRIILYAIGVGIPIVVIVTQTFDIVTCLTFPEKIILEKLQYLYNSMK